MPTPSEGFVNALRAFDPLLSVRWGEHIGRWVVERKAYIGDTEIWFLNRRTERFRLRAANAPAISNYQEQYDEIREELISLRRGTRTVLMPKDLNQKCFDMLGFMDIRGWGGYSRMADELEKREDFKERDLDRQMANEREALHKHTYDILDFAWRKRLTQLANGEHLHKSLKEIVGTSEL